MGRSNKNVIPTSPSIKWAEEAGPLVLPADERFTVKMPVPGYWDDNYDKLSSAMIWSEARFVIAHLHRPDFGLMRDYPQVGPLSYLEGVGFYKKKLSVPESWRGSRVMLQVGGARIDTWVWINGTNLGHKMGGHAFPLEWNLSDEIKPGEDNEIVIAVANCNSGVGGCDSWSLYGKSAGIFLPVHLKVSGKGRIADLYVCPVEANKKLKWNMELDGDISGGSIEWAVEDLKTGNLLAMGSTAASGKTCTWTTDTCGMKAWSDHHPRLYNLVVTLSAHGAKVDEVEQRFGLRKIAPDGISLRLNGQPVMLRGLTEACGYPVTKRPPTDKRFYRETITTVKSLGFNWLRFHTWVPNEEYLKAADELGMMIQVEQPWGYSPDLWESLIRHCRKHPSVILYCYGNENIIDDDLLKKLRGYAEQVHKLAPDALFSPQEMLRGIDGLFTSEESDPAKYYGDGYVTEPFPHNARRLKLIQEFSDVLASQAWSMLSYKCVHSDWKEIERRYSSYKRPILVHEIGTLGGYMDPGLECRYEGTPTGANPPMYEQFRRNLKEAGLWQNASRYYQNSCKLVNIPNGTVTRIGKFKLTGPVLDESKKLTLRLRLTGGQYDVENDWNYWAFPKNDPPSVNAAADDQILKQYGSRYKSLVPIPESGANLRFQSSLDKTAVDFMARGGSVALLGTRPFPTRKAGYQTYWQQDRTMEGTVVYDHPLTAPFPHEGWCDWQFYQMIDQAPMVNFNYSGLEFKPIIEGVTGYFDVKKLSSLFELRVGDGKLLVCTMKLDIADPASQCMLDNIVRYVASDWFQPAAATNPEHLSSLLSAKTINGEYIKQDTS